MIRVPTSEHRIAGKYGWWTNLFQVGRVSRSPPGHSPLVRPGPQCSHVRENKIMFSLITLLKPPFPPIPGIGREEQLPDGSIHREWTYGKFLMSPRWSGMDPELRTLVCRCMNEEPAQRPKLKEIMGILDEKMAQGHGAGSADSDAATRQWAEALFVSDAPPVPPGKPRENEKPERILTDELRREEEISLRMAAQSKEGRAQNWLNGVAPVEEEAEGEDVTQVHPPTQAGFSDFFKSGPMDLD